MASLLISLKLVSKFSYAEFSKMNLMWFCTKIRHIKLHGSIEDRFGFYAEKHADNFLDAETTRAYIIVNTKMCGKMQRTSLSHSQW